ncbi:MAG TPA: hypothetical protein VI322_02930 [Candidatus Saccharimonadia bacterium]
MCAKTKAEMPADRAHMHNNISDVVHVEDAAVTWGSFFQNLGWNVGRTYLQTDQALLVADDAHKLTFILNGDKVSNISVPATAEQFDTQQDPAGCSGSAAPTLRERLGHLF